MGFELIGNHPSIQKIKELISVVSDTGFNVLLLGETGTGKEVVAHLLHRSSSRKTNRFVKINCAALPLTLLESELFGYEKGAFTGADRTKPGKFELASGGVIFLDEIGDMPLLLQAKLLQVIQSGEFTRLGGTEEIKTNAWVISSTNHDLEKDIKEGLFREDLFYRLNIIKIELPQLRDRAEDINLLTDFFIRKHQEQLVPDDGFNLNPDLKSLFHAYHWPGNVRELSSAVLRLMLGDDPDMLRSEFLNNMEREGLSSPTKKNSNTPEESTQDPRRRKRTSETLRPFMDVKAEATRYIEKEVILHALNLSGWNKRKAATMLKISYKSLFLKLNEYGITNG